MIKTFLILEIRLSIYPTLSQDYALINYLIVYYNLLQPKYVLLAERAMLRNFLKFSKDYDYLIADTYLIL